jgi:muramoyltetrapeptide carboxypeptidase
MSKVKLTKPQKLTKGDTIGIISPAGSIFDVSKLENAKKYFEEKGYKVLISEHAQAQESYLAGSDTDKIEDIENLFQNKDVKAIICSRGGYGTLRILDKLNYNIISENPKIFVGYSDITSLHSAINKKAGLITFLGPLAVSDFGSDEIDEFTEENFFKMLAGDQPLPQVFPNAFEYLCIKEGVVEGALAGGNLAVLCSMIGTQYFPDVKNKILLLEDIGEPVYKIDRFLTQLELTGVLSQISGLLFAKFTKIGEDEDKLEKQVIELVREKTTSLNIPVGYGFSACHLKSKLTLPLGLNYRFDANKGKLVLIESPFIS